LFKKLLRQALHIVNCILVVFTWFVLSREADFVEIDLVVSNVLIYRFEI